MVPVHTPFLALCGPRSYNACPPQSGPFIICPRFFCDYLVRSLKDNTVLLRCRVLFSKAEDGRVVCMEFTGSVFWLCAPTM